MLEKALVCAAASMSITVIASPRVTVRRWRHRFSPSGHVAGQALRSTELTSSERKAEMRALTIKEGREGAEIESRSMRSRLA